MYEEQLLRYSRQIALPELDIEGQLKIIKSKVLIIGLGALGSVVANYLCRAGVGQLLLCDYDQIDISNLHRQVLYKESDVGKYKVDQTIKELRSINPECSLVGVNKEANNSNLEELISQNDLVVDATDNFASRYAINTICYSNKAFLVSGSALGWSGQITVLNLGDSLSPCYECIFGVDEKEDLSCSEAGVLAPVTGIIGSIQALEILKKILKIETYREGVLTNFDFLKGETQTIQIKSDPRCGTCGGK